MLDVIFYQTTEDLAGSAISGDSLIICPSPIVADGLRRLLPENYEIITISKWVSDHLKAKNLKKSNKAELILRFSSVWKHYFPNEEHHLFFKSFELFTDLRSFTLNLEMLSEFLKEIDEVTTKSILLFWTFLQNENLIDEHLSYQILGNSEEARPIWFMGFKHLSGIQIDMLRSISERSDVRIFFPRDVYPETLNTDWIRWLVPENKTDCHPVEKKIKILPFPKNKLNIVLDSLRKSNPQMDVSLACSNVTLNQRQEVSGKNVFFKSQEDLFSIQRDALIEELIEEVQSEPMEINAFVLKNEERKIAALKDENFIRYKILLLLNDSLVTYGEFQTSIDLFTIKVLKMILDLNSPRVALATLDLKPLSRLLELNELPYNESVSPLVIVASSSYGPLKPGESKYSEKMIEALRAIAPIKRSGLDFLYLKSELGQTLAKKGNILLMEEGLELIDLSWREILKDFKLEIINTKPDYRLKNKKDHLAAIVKSGPYELKHVSASRLQLFIDCPRKYYFSYVEKIDHRPAERLKIAADEMGVIEHKIIEQYFRCRKIAPTLSFEPDVHEVLCRQVLDGFIATNKVILNDKIKISTFYELVHYTRNGIEYLIEYCKQHSANKIEFEQPLGTNQWNIAGSSDCLVYLEENKVALFDFKRSGAAIGSKRETLSFDKIQIWVYLLMLVQKGYSIHSWGYLNLSEIEASMVYNEAESPVLNDITMLDFQKLLEKIINALKSEVHFSPKPRTPKVCNFCEMELFCLKGSCSP